MASILGHGKATIARITAERFGCKDEAMLQLIEKLAAADIVIGKPEFTPRSGPAVSMVELDKEFFIEAFYTLKGTMDGKPFCLTLSGPAVEDFA